MTNTHREFQARRKAYEAMPASPAKFAAIRSVVADADAAKNVYWQMEARYHLLIEELFEGDGGKVLPLAAKIATLYEAEGDSRFTPNQYLYTLMSAVGQWNSIPQLPLDQWKEMMEHFYAAVRKYSMGLTDYYEQVCYRAFRQGDFELAKRTYEKWKRVPATAERISSCPGCHRHFQAFYAKKMGDIALTMEMAKPLLDGTIACHQEPDAILELLLDFALQRQDWEDAHKWAKRLRRESMKEGALEYDASLLEYFALFSPDEGRTMLEKAMDKVLGYWDQDSLFYLYEGGWAVCAHWPEEAISLNLPKRFPLWLENGKYAAKELARWFYDQAVKIAQAFESRDGYPHYTRQLELMRKNMEALIQSET